MLMAQVAIDREDQKPRLALDHLARIKTADRGTLAIVRLNEGKAYSALGRNDQAERAWKEALRLEPARARGGLGPARPLLRPGSSRGGPPARHGALRHRARPPRSRPTAPGADPPGCAALGSDSLIRTLEPLVRAHPEDFHTAVALGLALIRNSRIDEGLTILRGLVERHAEQSGHLGRPVAGPGRGPTTRTRWPRPWRRSLSELSGDPRFDRHRAAIAQERRDWATAADGYLGSWSVDPSDFQILYRLSQVLKAAGRLEEARKFDHKVRAAQEARDQVLPLYKEANAEKTLGVAPHADLYHRLADLRERMGRPDEALAWHRLVLRDQPDDPISREAVARLQASIDAEAMSRR